MQTLGFFCTYRCVSERGIACGEKGAIVTSTSITLILPIPGPKKNFKNISKKIFKKCNVWDFLPHIEAEDKKQAASERQSRTPAHPLGGDTFLPMCRDISKSQELSAQS